MPLVHHTQLAAKISVTATFVDQHDRKVQFDAEKWEHIDQWDAIVCPAVLVSRKELFLLLAERMNCGRTRRGMLAVAKCKWTIGRHVTVTTSEGYPLHYYGHGTSAAKNNKYPTWVEVAGYDKVTPGSRRNTSRLARVVCGIQLTDIKTSTGFPLAPALIDVVGKKGEDTVTFLLVRYATPHESATQRGPEHRPLCPGPLQYSHCLWKWAKRHGGYSRGCFRPRPWERHRRLFGRTLEEQQSTKQADLLAWYDIIQLTNIKCYVNVHPDPSTTETNVFLQSLLFC